MRFQKGHAPVNSNKMVATRKARGNYKWSEESKEKASIAHTGTKKPWASKNIAMLMETMRIHKEPTKIEFILKYVVDTLTLPWQLQYKVKTPSGYTLADLYIPTLNILVYADGCYWHGCPEHSKPNRWYKRDKDRKLDDELRTMGYKVIRIWGHEFVDVNFVRNIFRKEMGLSLLETTICVQQ